MAKDKDAGLAIIGVIGIIAMAIVLGMMSWIGYSRFTASRANPTPTVSPTQAPTNTPQPTEIPTTLPTNANLPTATPNPTESVYFHTNLVPIGTTVQIPAKDDCLGDVAVTIDAVSNNQIDITLNENIINFNGAVYDTRELKYTLTQTETCHQLTSNCHNKQTQYCFSVTPQNNTQRLIYTRREISPTIAPVP